MKKEIKVSKLKDVEPRTISKGFQVRRLITKKREGSETMTPGLAELDPGCEEHAWFYKEYPVDEVYYIILRQ